MGIPTVCASKRELKERTRGHINPLDVHPGCTAQTKFVWCMPRPKILQHLWSLGVPYAHKSCPCNELVSLTNRVMAPTEAVTSRGRYLLRHFHYAADAIGKAVSGAKLSRRSFLEAVKIPGKRKIYEKAVQELERWGWDYGDGKLSSFVKVESVAEESKDPRMIQARSPAYNVELGCYLKPVEHRILALDFSRVFGFGPNGRLIAKGLNNVQRGGLIRTKFDRFTHCAVVGIDASRFDMHVSLDMLKHWEHRIYTAAYRNDEYLRRLLRWQQINAGRTRGGIRYAAKGGRASGDQNTGLGNSLITIFLAFSFFADRPEMKWDFLCDGDDALIFCEEDQLGWQEDFRVHCASLGFKMAIEESVTNIDQIDFCQSRPIEVTHGKWVMVRNPVRAIYRSALSNTSMATIPEALQTLWAIGSCELALHAGIPIMQEFALYCLRNGIKPTEKKLDLMKYRLTYKYWDLPKNNSPRPITTFARSSFAAAFGISIGEQLLLEKAFSQTNFKLHGYTTIPEPVDLGAGEVNVSSDSVYVL